MNTHDIEQHRPAFEAACRAHAEEAGYDGMGDLTRDGDGYADPATQAAWWGWRQGSGRQGRGEPVAWIVTGPYQKQAFAMKSSAEAFCRGLNKGFEETAYSVSALYSAPKPADPVAKDFLTVAEPVKDLQRAVEAYQIAEQECAQRHSDARNLIEPGIAVEAGLIAAAPFLAWQQPANPTIKQSLTVAEPVKVPSDDLDDEENAKKWFDLALNSGATRRRSLDDEEVATLSFSLSSFENFCGVLLANYGQPAQPAASAEPVAYLDLGVGGYIDLGSDLSDGQLSQLPKGRHMLGIIGTHGANGYSAIPVAAQPSVPEYKLVPVVPTQEMLVSILGEGERLAHDTTKPEYRASLLLMAGTHDRYAAMLAAAPTPPTAEQAQEPK